jgi:hypothetical protein
MPANRWLERVLTYCEFATVLLVVLSVASVVGYLVILNESNRDPVTVDYEVRY